MDTGGPVGVGNSPLLQATDKLGRDAGSTELLCRFPYLSAADFAVAAGERTAARATHPIGKYFSVGYCRFLSIQAASSELVNARRKSTGSGLKTGSQTGLIMMRGSMFCSGRQPCR